MAPSITETLFALGVGDRVVGVTRYCDYPPEAKQRQQIGGYYDPSYEAIIALEPDLVVHLPEQATAGKHLTELDVERLQVDHRSIDDVIDSIEKIARRVDRVLAGARLVSRLRDEMARVGEKTRGRPRPRVLISVGRTMGSGSVKDVYAAGRDGFYDRLVELAGGHIAFDDPDGPRFPKLSGEGLLRLDPDVVVELAADLEQKGLTEAAVRAEWRNLRDLRAVRKGRVHVLSGDHITIPGPRSHLLLRDLARLLHPEVDWSAP